MRIVIDLQGAQTASRFRGIGRYSTALTRAIVRNAGEHDIWLVLNAALEESIAQIRADFDGLVPQNRIRVFELPGAVAALDTRNAGRGRAAELMREQFIALLKPDMVLVTSLFEGYADDSISSVGTFVDGVRTAVILYDLIPLLNPPAYLGTPSVHQWYMRKIDSLRRAGLLLSISAHSRTEAIDALDLDPDRVAAISTAVDDNFVPRTPTPAVLAAIRERYGITRAFVMCAPGGYDVRKNLFGLVTAFSLLPAALRGAHQLLIASRLIDAERSALLAHARRKGLAEDELLLTGYVSDETLVALYQAAALFVFPSLHEGFGMPVLEAMACGTPSIGSNTSSIPEVVGLEEALFDPTQPQSIAEKIAEVLTDRELYERLRRHGTVQAATFSWDKTALRALDALTRHHEATKAVAPARPHGELLGALAAVPGLPYDETTLLKLAYCLAAFPDLATPPRLLIDAGMLATDEHASDPTFASRLALALLNEPPSGTLVELVRLSHRHGVWHYRYARAEARALSGASVPAGPDAVADIHTGDLLLCTARSAPDLVAAAQDGLYGHLHRLGVALHVMLGSAAPDTDMAPVLEHATQVMPIATLVGHERTAGADPDAPAVTPVQTMLALLGLQRQVSC